MSDTKHIRQVSLRRIIWVTYVKITTIWIPNALLNYRLTTKERQQAWREKLALFCTFLFICGLFSFWLEYITYLFCDPPATLFYKEVFSNHSHYSSINGQVVDWSKLGNSSAMTQQVNLYPHHDLSSMFPTFMLLQRSQDKPTYSNSIINSCINQFNRSTQADNWLQYKLTQDPGYLYEQEQLISCPLPYQRNETGASCFYTLSDMQEYQKYHKKGALEFTAKLIAANYSTLPSDYTEQRAFVILDNKVLDVTDYLTAATTLVQVAKDTYSRSFALDRMFLPLDLTVLLFLNIGQDISDDFHETIADGEIYKECLLELFYQGIIDGGDDEGCARINLALWVTMGWFFLYFLIRMNLANLSDLPSWLSPPLTPSDKTSQPGNLMRFSQPYLLLFIPCFTETSELVRRTFDSLARSNYPDDRKLLFFVCDGVARNKTETKETYLCILEALGYSSSKEPEVRSYISLGQGTRRINGAKVYAGFYESGSNRVPFLMVVKVGLPAESITTATTTTTRVPGNRGKRDSMVLVLGFLERCMHLAQHRITPLEYELFNHCYNVLGIDPREIKYMLATDADIQVQDDAIFKMVSRLEADPSIAALSGHLKPANPEENVITMLQIFPLYLSFFSGLSYEACLGKVTTLNGGFAMYRLWSGGGGGGTSRKWPKVSDEIHDPPYNSSSDDDEEEDDYTTTTTTTTTTSNVNTITTTTATTTTTTTNTSRPQRRRLQNPTSKKRKMRRVPMMSLPVPLISDDPTRQACCINPTVLRGFAATRPNTMHMKNVLLLGEEQYFSVVLVRSLPHHVLGFEAGAIGYSVLPTQFRTLQALMTRTLRVVFHQQLEIQAMARHLGLMHWILSSTKLLDLIFTVPLTCYLYSIFIRYFIYKSLAFAIITGSFTCLMLLHVVFFLLRRQFKYVPWFLIYCLFSVPLFHVYFPLLAIWCSDYADYWYDPESSSATGRLHGIVEEHSDDDDDDERNHEDDIPRLRLSEFEVVEAEKAAMREKAQVEMLDATFSDFTPYVNSVTVRGHANQPSWSSSVSSAAQVKIVHRFASEDPFLLQDPFEHHDDNNVYRPPSWRTESPVHHYRSHSNTSASTTNNDTDSIISLNPSLVTSSVISIKQEDIPVLEQEEHHQEELPRWYTTRTRFFGVRRRPEIYYEEISEGRSAPIHSKFNIS